jgi:hypothetical protein
MGLLRIVGHNRYPNSASAPAVLLNSVEITVHLPDDLAARLNLIQIQCDHVLPRLYRIGFAQLIWLTCSWEGSQRQVRSVQIDRVDVAKVVILFWSYG